MAPQSPKSRLSLALGSPIQSSPTSAGSNRHLSSTYQPILRSNSRSSRANDSNGNSAKSGRRISSKPNQQHRDSNSKRVHDVDGFDFDPLASTQLQRRMSSLRRDERNNSRSDTETLDSIHEEKDEKQRLNEVGQLATVFLEVRKGIMDEMNIDVQHNERIEHEREHNKHPHPRHIPKSVLNRVERVKLMFNLYYFAISQSQKISDPQYAGVDGVYNPLQIIRNRELRKKYKQTPQFTMKTLPQASTAFSKTKTKLLWEVDVTELTFDTSWRAQHWHELVGPKGELWFPLEKKHKKTHHHNRYHLNDHGHEDDKEEPKLTRYDQLFDSVDNENIDDEIEDIQFRHSRSSSKSDLLEVPRPGRKKRDRIIGKIRSKSPFRKSDRHVDEIDDELYPSISGSSSSHDVKKTEYTVDETELGSGSQTSFKILSDIEIEPIKPSITITVDTPTEASVGTTSTNNSQLDHSSTSNSITRQEPPEIDEAELKEIKAVNAHLDKLRYLHTLMDMFNHDYEYRRLEYQNLTKFEKLNGVLARIEQSLTRLKDLSLPACENTFKGKAESLRSIHNELVSDYSMRMDKMLTLSDRTIGEVNTTLSLEVRRLNERFEKVNSLKKDSQCDELANFGYWVLENFVVLLLWSIWVVVSLLRLVRFTALMVIGILKWLLS